jgi:hypothetical protein
METSTGQEAEEPMYLHIAGPMPDGVAKAKGLCEELLERVRTDYQEFKENAPHHRFGGGGGDRYSNGRSGGYDGRSGGGYEGRSGGYDGRPGGYGDRERSQSYGQTGYGGQGGQSDYQQPAAAAAADPAAQGADYSQWQAYYAQTGQQPGADPYAQYGGYEGYVQWYNYYAQLQQQQSPAPGTAAAPPPPPSDSGPPGGAPPPPPPSGSPPGTSYNAVSKLDFCPLCNANNASGSSASWYVSLLVWEADLLVRFLKICLVRSRCLVQNMRLLRVGRVFVSSFLPSCFGFLHECIVYGNRL